MDRRKSRRFAAIGAVAALLVLGGLVVVFTASSTPNDDAIRSWCSTASGRDFVGQLEDRTADATVGEVVVDGQVLDAEFNQDAATTMAKLISEDAPSAVTADARITSTALQDALAGEPPEGADLTDALEAAARVDEFATENC